MRVTHLGKFYPPVPGGMERVLQSLCEGERDRGIDTRALVVNTGRATLHDSVNGVPVTRAGSMFRLGSVWFAPALISLVRHIDTDILVLHEPNPMALLAFALVRPRHRLIVWYHSEVLRPRWRYKLIYAPFLEVAFRRALRIVVSSPPLVEHARALSAHRRRCEVIPFGIDIGGAGPREPHHSIREVRAAWSGPIALFVGRLVAYKGVDVLLRALVESNVAAVIIGAGPLEGELRAMASGLGVQSRAFFLGAVDDGTVAAWYEACDFLVLPSVTRAEAFGIVQLEAMARGKPVVSTRLATGVPWVNVDGTTGIGVPPGNAGALAAAMRGLGEDPAARRRMGAAARERYRQEFTRDRMIARTVQMYRDVAGEPLPVRPRC